MARAIRGHDLAATVAMVMIAALLVLVALVFVVQQTATTSYRSGTPMIGADRAGGSSFAHDPYVNRHAEVVTRYQADTPAMSEARAGGSSLTRQPAIERHAEIVARYNQDNLR